MWEIPHVTDGTVVVLGGGPSLRDVDLSLLAPYTVIGTNNAYSLPNVPYNFFMDIGWWKRNKDEAAGYTGVMITDAPDPEGVITEPWVKRLHRYNDYGMNISRRDGLPWNRNSGAGAINLAAIMGASRILLLGFDMQPVAGAPNKGNNWHDKHKAPPDPRQYEKFMRYFDTMKLDLERINTVRKLEIINCTPGSALKCFPIMRLEEAL